MVTHHQKSPSATTVVVIAIEISDHYCTGILVTRRAILEILINRARRPEKCSTIQ